MAEPTAEEKARAHEVHNRILGAVERHPFMCEDCDFLASLLAEVREQARELAEDSRDGDWCEAFGAVRSPVTQSRRREMVREARREGREEMRERAAALHESIDNDCDRDRFRRTVTGCGCGAMGAVIEYRDAIRALPLDGPEEGR